jgi:hypothetical protein
VTYGFIVQEETTGKWLADCVDPARGCHEGDPIGSYEDASAAARGLAGHEVWHIRLDRADEARRVDLARQLTHVESWRHSEWCERYAAVTVRDCLCGLAEWQEFYRRSLGNS